MKISYAISTWNEHVELEKLLSFLVKHIDENDEIVVQCDKGNTTPEVYKVLDSFKAPVGLKDPLKVIESCRSLINKGRDPSSILQGITSILRDLVIVKLAPDKRELCGVSNQFFEVLQYYQFFEHLF